jgi:hypothetical protein
MSLLITRRATIERHRLVSDVGGIEEDSERTLASSGGGEKRR